MLEEEIKSIAQALRNEANKRFLLVPHDRPDGDALGSMLALADALRKAGKEVHTILVGPVGARYEFLFEGKSAPVVSKDISPGQLPEVDVAMVIDTSATRQLGSLTSWLEAFAGTLIVIDHHTRGDLSCQLELIDENCPATGLLVGKLLDYLGWLNDPQIAQYVLIAIGTDTGWFSYSNTTPECLKWAARLAEQGVSLRQTYERLFLSEPPERFRLLARTLSSAELFADGRIVVFTLKQRDFAETEASEYQTENLIDQATRLKTMQVAVLFVEAADNSVRISLRSRELFDVHTFAKRFGGGGHRKAAGVKLAGCLAEIKPKIINELIHTLG